MRYISLFSGIEAASVAWESLGWEPVAFSEIEPFACDVLETHYPHVPNLGDICSIDWKEVLKKYGTIDLIVGGSPCQSFSIAGGRASLDGESRLMFEYIRAVDEIRPTWFLWENVPGALSVRDNAFGQLVGELADLGYGLAWRVLDAQFFGVAQRRRRVFLVGHIGDTGSPAAVLFNADSVCGNTSPSKEKRQELARSVSGSFAAGFKHKQGAKAGGLGYQKEQAPTLVCDSPPAVMAFNDTQITSPKNGNVPVFGGPCHTLSRLDRPPRIALQSDGRTSMNSQGDGYKDDGSAYTLNCVDRQSVLCMTNDTANAAIDAEMSGTLLRGGRPPMIVQERSRPMIGEAQPSMMREQES